MTGVVKSDRKAKEEKMEVKQGATERFASTPDLNIGDLINMQVRASILTFKMNEVLDSFSVQGLSYKSSTAASRELMQTCTHFLNLRAA